MLHSHFGPLHGPAARRPWWPIFSEHAQLEIIVGAVLVQQTRWETVEAAIERLHGAGFLQVAALASADPDQLAALIRPAAFHTQKAPGLIAIARHIQRQYAGSVAALLNRPTQELRTELLALPRIGRETCDVIMLYAGGHAIFVIDEYTRRLFERVAPEEHRWRAPYDVLRTAIEQVLQTAPQAAALAALYAEYHAQINEACVRYCLSKPRCDGPPARRIYSRQQGRENYLDRDEGCPLRAICATYQATRSSR
ncbi:MAG: Fe-S cluster assembly protein HesB [Oscillochloris sp.]|nr:Fe-S cluster assembly protein HesB [Oscillochloris sp.]